MCICTIPPLPLKEVTNGACAHALPDKNIRGLPDAFVPTDVRSPVVVSVTENAVYLSDSHHVISHAAFRRFAADVLVEGTFGVNLNASSLQ